MLLATAPDAQGSSASSLLSLVQQSFGIRHAHRKAKPTAQPHLDEAYWAAELTAQTCDSARVANSSTFSGGSSSTTSSRTGLLTKNTSSPWSEFVHPAFMSEARRGSTLSRSPTTEAIPQRKHLVLAPHHKTGFVFSQQSIDCINGVYPGSAMLVMGRFLKPGFAVAEDVFLAHINRDPMQLVVSTYLYNKITADASEEHEPQIFNRGSATWVKKRIQAWTKAEPTWMEVPDEQESFREFLQRVPEEVGLRAVLFVTLEELAAIEFAAEWCETSGQCMEVHLDVLTRDSRAYILTWLTMLHKAGLEPTAELERCLSMLDTNHPLFLSSRSRRHCASQKVTPEEWHELTSIAKIVDASWLNGRYAKASSRYLEKQHSFEFRRRLIS